MWEQTGLAPFLASGPPPAAEAGLTWVAIFRHGLSRALPGQSQKQIKVKSVGHECPTHTGKVNVGGKSPPKGRAESFARGHRRSRFLTGLSARFGMTSLFTNCLRQEFSVQLRLLHRRLRGILRCDLTGPYLKILSFRCAPEAREEPAVLYSGIGSWSQTNSGFLTGPSTRSECHPALLFGKARQTPIEDFAQAVRDICCCNLNLRILKILSFRCARRAREEPAVLCSGEFPCQFGLLHRDAVTSATAPFYANP